MNNCEECGWPEPCDCEPERSAGSLERDGSASEAIVYAGKHYGRKHRILFDTGNLVTLIHEPSGDTLTVHSCDVERETPNTKLTHD